MYKQPPQLFFHTVNQYNKPEKLSLAILLEVDYSAMLPYSIKPVDGDSVYFVTKDGHVWYCLGDGIDAIPHQYIGKVDEHSLTLALEKRKYHKLTTRYNPPEPPKIGSPLVRLTHYINRFK